MARTNRELLTGGRKYRQRQAKKFGVEEVVFDPNVRQEFLTGFHKRKVERQKKAKAFHEKQERLRRIEERRLEREQRQKEFEEKMKERDMVKNLELARLGADSDDDNKRGTAGKDAQSQEGDLDDSKSTWEGFGSDGLKKDSDDEETPLKGILHTKHVYKIDDPRTLGDAVVDEETTVTINLVDNPYMIRTGVSFEEIARANRVNLQKSEEVLEKSIDRAKKYAVICGVDKNKRKKKKKKFRYLTKGERSDNNQKIKLSKMKSRKRE